MAIIYLEWLDNTLSYGNKPYNNQPYTFNIRFSSVGLKPLDFFIPTQYYEIKKKYNKHGNQSVNQSRNLFEMNDVDSCHYELVWTARSFYKDNFLMIIPEIERVHHISSKHKFAGYIVYKSDKFKELKK